MKQGDKVIEQQQDMSHETRISLSKIVSTNASYLMIIYIRGTLKNFGKIISKIYECITLKSNLKQQRCTFIKNLAKNAEERN